MGGGGYDHGDKKPGETEAQFQARQKGPASSSSNLPLDLIPTELLREEMERRAKEHAQHVANAKALLEANGYSVTRARRKKGGAE